ncbi:Adenylate cyclase type 10, partial [Blyttiomyces sp. JEL0837]
MEKGQNIQELAKTIKAGKDKKHGIKVPVIVVLIALLLVSVGAITIPLGAIIANNAANVVDDMTQHVIDGVMRESVHSVEDFLESFAGLIHAAGENTALDDVFKYHYKDYSIPMPNVTSVMVKTAWQNKYINGLVPPGTPGYNVTSVGIIKEPCSALGLPYGGICALRTWTDYNNGKALSAAIIDPDTTQDLQFLGRIVENSTDAITNRVYQRFVDLHMGPYFRTDYINGGYAGWFLLHQYVYLPNATRKETARMCRGYLMMESSLESFFATVKPTDDSILFMIDDENKMIVSTVNGTVSPNSTYRYYPYEAPDAIIKGASQSLLNQYGDLSKLPNTTSQVLNLAGEAWIVNTATTHTPHSGQAYQIFLCIRRSYYYGASEAAFKRALIIAVVLTVVGLLLVITLGYFAVRPLQSLVVSMQTLTQFDFSVIENGDLNNRSIVKEIFLVESTFLTMVKVDGRTLPWVEPAPGGGLVAIIDISGYSKLTSRLTELYGSNGGALLKELINPPFEKIINKVYARGGSIVKFVGDAVIATWSPDSGKTHPTDEMIISAVLCCLELLRIFQDYTIQIQPNQNQFQSNNNSNSNSTSFPPGGGVGKSIPEGDENSVAGMSSNAPGGRVSTSSLQHKPILGSSQFLLNPDSKQKYLALSGSRGSSVALNNIRGSKDLIAEEENGVGDGASARVSTVVNGRLSVAEGTGGDFDDDAYTSIGGGTMITITPAGSRDLRLPKYDNAKSVGNILGEAEGRGSGASRPQQQQQGKRRASLWSNFMVGAGGPGGGGNVGNVPGNTTSTSSNATIQQQQQHQDESRILSPTGTKRRKSRVGSFVMSLGVGTGSGTITTRRTSFSQGLSRDFGSMTSSNNNNATGGDPNHDSIEDIFGQVAVPPSMAMQINSSTGGGSGLDSASIGTGKSVDKIEGSSIDGDLARIPSRYLQQRKSIGSSEFSNSNALAKIQEVTSRRKLSMDMRSGDASKMSNGGVIGMTLGAELSGDKSTGGSWSGSRMDNVSHESIARKFLGSATPRKGGSAEKGGGGRGEAEVPQQLKIHIGLALGEVFHVHLGEVEDDKTNNNVFSFAAGITIETDDGGEESNKKLERDVRTPKGRLEYFVGGHAVEEAGGLLGFGQPGDLTLSAYCWREVRRRVKNETGVDLPRLDHGTGHIMINFADVKVDLVVEALESALLQMKVRIGMKKLAESNNDSDEEDDDSLHHAQKNSEKRKDSHDDYNVRTESLRMAISYMDESLSRYLASKWPEFHQECHLSTATTDFDQIRKVTVVFLRMLDIPVATIGEPEHLNTAQLVVESVIDVVRKFDGCFRQFVCDDKAATALMVWGLEGFTHERGDTVYAVAAAMQLSRQLTAQFGGGFSIGVATGTVFAGIIGNSIRSDGTILGNCVNLAARIMCHAVASNTVVCCEDTYNESKSDFRFRDDIAPVQFKGIKSPSRLFSPISKFSVDRTHFSIMMDGVYVGGRDKEFQTLKKALMDWSRGEPTVIVVSGSAGAGKSSLGQKLKRDIMLQKNILLCTGRGKEDKQNSNLFAIEQVLRDMFLQLLKSGVNLKDIRDRAVQLQFGTMFKGERSTAKLNDMSASNQNVSDGNGNGNEENDSDSEVSVGSSFLHLEKFIRGLFMALSEGHTPLTRVFTAFPSLTDHHTRRSYNRDVSSDSLVADAVCTIIQKLILAVPIRLCIMLDDFHWLDAASIEFTQTIMRKCPDVLFFILSRPIEQFKSSAQTRFRRLLEQPSVTHVKLMPLKREGVEEIMSHHLRGLLKEGETISEPLVSDVLQKSQGNPLVIGVICQMLLKDPGLKTVNGVLHRFITYDNSGSEEIDMLATDTVSAITAHEILPFAIDTTNPEEFTPANIRHMIEASDIYGFVTLENDSCSFSNYLIQQSILINLLPSRLEQLRTLYVDYYERSLDDPANAFNIPTLIYHLLQVSGDSARKVKYLYIAFLQAAERYDVVEGLEYHTLYREEVQRSHIKIKRESVEFAKEHRLLAQLHLDGANPKRAAYHASKSLFVLGMNVEGHRKNRIERHVKRLLWNIWRQIHPSTDVWNINTVSTIRMSCDVLFGLFPKAFPAGLEARLSAVLGRSKILPFLKTSQATVVPFEILNLDEFQNAVTEIYKCLLLNLEIYSREDSQSLHDLFTVLLTFPSLLETSRPHLQLSMTRLAALLHVYGYVNFVTEIAQYALQQPIISEAEDGVEKILEHADLAVAHGMLAASKCDFELGILELRKGLEFLDMCGRGASDVAHGQRIAVFTMMTLNGKISEAIEYFTSCSQQHYVFDEGRDQCASEICYLIAGLRGLSANSAECENWQDRGESAADWDAPTDVRKLVGGVFQLLGELAMAATSVDSNDVVKWLMKCRESVEWIHFQSLRSPATHNGTDACKSQQSYKGPFESDGAANESIITPSTFPLFDSIHSRNEACSMEFVERSPFVVLVAGVASLVMRIDREVVGDRGKTQVNAELCAMLEEELSGEGSKLL